jgi:hypothetical protein
MQSELSYGKRYFFHAKIFLFGDELEIAVWAGGKYFVSTYL